MADSAVRFNGVLLDEIAPDIRIDDIDVSPIVYNAVASDRPIRFGREFVRNVGATRTVTITFAIQLDDRDAREAQLQAAQTGDGAVAALWVVAIALPALAFVTIKRKRRI